MRFYQFVLKNVFRRKVRSALTVTGMAAAVGMAVSLVGIADGFKKSFVSMYEARQVGLIVSDKREWNPMFGTMPEAVATKLQAMKTDGVTGVAAGLIDMIDMEDQGLNHVVFQGWKPDSFMFEEIRGTIIDPPALASGSENLVDLLKREKGVLLEKTAADALAKKPGDKLMLFGHYEFEVVAVYKAEASLEKGHIIMLLDQLQKLQGKPQLITGCTVRLAPEVRKDDVRRKEICRKIEQDIAAEVGAAGKIKALPPDEYNLNQMRMATGMSFAIALVAVGIGALFMLNTMVMSVFERTREIGILRAIGWRPGRIMRMIFMESLLLSLAGFVLGTAGAAVLTYFLSRLPLTSMISSTTSPFVILLAFGISLLVGVLGAAYPGYRGAMLMPTEAIRHE